MAKKKDSLSMWERTEYDVISETLTESGLTAVIRVRHSGAEVICNIPKHTPEEERKLASDLTRALMQIARTGQDINRISSMEILKD